MTSTKVSKTVDTLLDAAAAVLARNPGASIADVAVRAGVSRATLYRYFPSREALIRALAIEALGQTDEATASLRDQTSSSTETLQLTIGALVPLGERFHFLMAEFGVMGDPEVAEIYERQQSELSNLVEAVKAEGDIAREIPTAWVVTVIDTLIYAAWTSVEEGFIASRDAVDLVNRTLFSGLS